MRNDKERSTSNKVTFKEKKKPHDDQESSTYEFDEEEAKFVRKLKRGSNKYKVCYILSA